MLADPAGKRLFIADTGHNRIIQTDLEGAEPVAIGSGEEGFDDGGYGRATFNRPQGMCLDGETLYVADTENHAIRAVDLKERTVTTIAGIGSQARNIPHPGSSGPARTTAAVQPLGRDPARRRQGPLHRHGRTAPDLEARPGSKRSACSPDRARRISGMARTASANFAQPSGLATDGENLFVADSEVSGVRVITGIGGNAARGAYDRRPGPLRVRRQATAAARRSGSSIAWDWPTPAATSTSPTPTTTRSRSATPGTASVKTPGRLAQAGRQR